MTFDEQLEIARPIAAGIVYRIVRNPDVVDDVLQEASIKAWRAYPTFEQRSSFSTWFCMIAKNYALMHLRRKKPETTDLSKAARVAANPDPSPEQMILAGERSEAIARAVDCLTPICRRAIIVWMDRDQYSRADPAMPNLLKSQVFHAKAKLRSSLESLA